MRCGKQVGRDREGSDRGGDLVWGSESLESRESSSMTILLVGPDQKILATEGCD